MKVNEFYQLYNDPNSVIKITKINNQKIYGISVNGKKHKFEIYRKHFIIYSKKIPELKAKLLYET